MGEKSKVEFLTLSVFISSVSLILGVAFQKQLRYLGLSVIKEKY